MKSKQRDYNRDINGNLSLPERLFKGTFVVFTVTALLELPTGVSDEKCSTRDHLINETLFQSSTGIKGTYKSLKRQGSLIIRDRAPKFLSTLSINPQKDTPDKNKNVSRLTASETQRNIGSVTFFLDAKSFEENVRTKSFSTNEMWLSIRDITVTPNAKLSVSSIEHVALITQIEVGCDVFDMALVS